ncbi:MAG: PD-(D/E)XK nuclease family protein [Betaproteobacteria bacterium]|nr:PD-(D/E)XK nuclease family protein [Betaproteobacteria bacterium]
MTAAVSETIEFRDLAARLAHEPHGALTAVTPNNRLAQCLASAVGDIHAASGRTSWPAADILPWGAWLERLHEDARFDDEGAAVPPLFTADHERLGWEAAISRDASRNLLVGPAALAREAQGAWSLAHDWGIEGAIGTWEGAEDAQAFAGWARSWREESRQLGGIDAARLASIVPALLARTAVRRPKMLVAYAFHIVTPAQRFVIDACRAAGIAVATSESPRHDAAPRVIPAESPRREIELAACWARSRLEAAAGKRMPRIGVVVPDLAQRRDWVARVFARVFAPGGRPRGAPLYNLSMGKALADYPLVDCALALLGLADEPVAFERASRIVRSPFLGESGSELASRARLDAALRRISPPRVDLASLRALVSASTAEGGRWHVPACPALEARLEAVASIVPPGRSASAPAWAAHFAARLFAAGFPGERTLDSAEHQALVKWHEALARLGSLGVVAGTLTSEAARRHLRQFCLDTVFQPESGDAPVQVLGLLESVGLDFDALWVAGLTDDSWPQSPRPNPFLPVSLQRKAAVPQASAEASLALDLRITESWAQAADEVVFSHGLMDDERTLGASALIAGYEAADPAALGIPSCEGLRDALFAAGRNQAAWAGREDRVAPPLETNAARGGTAILADQAACPFRAFARHRLRAEGLEKTEPGLGAAERGQLLHRVMARLWREIGSHAALAAMDPVRLEALAADAARIAVAWLRSERPGRLEGRFAALERERLARVALAWLDIDRSRAPFCVVHREEELAIEAGGLVFRGRIDRLDRLENAGLAVIDYKTGSPRVRGWLGDRPDDPQLPLYALAVGDEVTAVAFACLKAGKVGFAGLAREDGLLPDVGTVDKHRTAGKFAASWSELIEGWRLSTARLAREFAEGKASVDPKRPFATCKHCDLSALCRVRERLGALAADEASEDAGNDE